jgi:hypothetical protein
VDGIADVIKEIPLLSTFLVKGHLHGRKGLENCSDVHYRSTSDADPQVWKSQGSKVRHEFQDFFTGCWYPREIGTFVERVHEDVGCWLSWEIEHIFKTLCKSCVSCFPRASSVCRVQAREDVVARAGLTAELLEEGR